MAIGEGELPTTNPEMQKTMYSVTDGGTDPAGNTDGALQTGTFHKAKMSRSQLEQRSILQLNEVNAPSANVNAPEQRQIDDASNLTPINGGNVED